MEPLAFYPWPATLIRKIGNGDVAPGIFDVCQVEVRAPLERFKELEQRTFNWGLPSQRSASERSNQKGSWLLFDHADRDGRPH